VFYTSLGHKIGYYSDPVFRRHLLGGIRWALGETNATANPRLP
jgi:type 1 glutamine amidotransferase